MITRIIGRTVLDAETLAKADKNYVCVVQLATQPQGILHCVTLRPDKIRNGLIRIGDTPGDEAAGWQHPNNIQIHSILGTAQIKETSIEVTPLDEVA